MSFFSIPIAAHGGLAKFFSSVSRDLFIDHIPAFNGVKALSLARQSDTWLSALKKFVTIFIFYFVVICSIGGEGAGWGAAWSITHGSSRAESFS